MIKLYVIRHGQSFANIAQTEIDATPDHQVELTHNGENQIHQLGTFLSESVSRSLNVENTRMWVSPYKRTIQTAQILNSYLKLETVRSDVRLVEQSFGIYNGVPKEMWGTMFPHEFNHQLRTLRDNTRGKYWARFPMGESPLDVAVRVKSFFETVFRDYEKRGIDTLFIVTHGVTLRIILMEWMHYSTDWYEDEPNPLNGAMRYIENHVDLGYIFTPSVNEKVN